MSKSVWNGKKVVTSVVCSWTRMILDLRTQGRTCRYQATQLNFPCQADVNTHGSG